jgi:hypothetical protein
VQLLHHTMHTQLQAMALSLSPDNAMILQLQEKKAECQNDIPRNKSELQYKHGQG